MGLYLHLLKLNDGGNISANNLVCDQLSLPSLNLLGYQEACLMFPYRWRV